MTRSSRTPAPNQPTSKSSSGPAGTRAASLSLVGGPGSRALDIVLRGADANSPPVLSDVNPRLEATAVRLAHIVFEGTVSDVPLLRIAANTPFAVAVCAFIDNQARMPPAVG
jgi:hypothetical protein